MDGSPGRGLGRDHRLCLLPRFVRGLVRGQAQVTCAVPVAVWSVLPGRGQCSGDAVLQHDSGGDGQGMSCLHDVCVLEIVDVTITRWGVMRVKMRPFNGKRFFSKLTDNMVVPSKNVPQCG